MVQISTPIRQAFSSRSRRYAVLFGVLGLSKLLALLSSAVIARFFDREVSGMVFFITGITTLSISITTLGLSAASSYYYSRNMRRARHGRNWQIFNLSLAVAVLPSAALAFLALTMEETRGALGPWIVMVLAIGCFMAAARQMARMIFTIENRRDWSIVHDNVTYNAAFILIILLCGIALHSRDLSLVVGLVAVLVASIAAGGFAIWHTFRKLTGGRGPFDITTLPNRRYIGVLMAISIPSMIAQGSALLLNKIDVVMIGPLAGSIEVGTYSVAMRVTYLAGLLTEIVALFLAPKIIAIGASGNRQKQWYILKVATGMQVLALAVTTIPLVIFREPIIALIFGQDYINVAPTYLILQAGKTLTAIFGPVIALFTALGYNREMAKVAVLAAIVNVLLNIFLIPRWGANGASFATTIALLIMFVNYVWLSWKIRKLSVLDRKK